MDDHRRHDGEGALEGAFDRHTRRVAQLIDVTGAAGQGNQIEASLNIEPGAALRSWCAPAAQSAQRGQQSGVAFGDVVVRSDDPATDER